LVINSKKKGIIIQKDLEREIMGISDPKFFLQSKKTNIIFIDSFNKNAILLLFSSKTISKVPRYMIRIIHHKLKNINFLD
jgi:hypothetical protein